MDALMGDFGFSIELDRNRGVGRQGAVARLGRIERKSQDFTPALEKIRKSFQAAERAQFASEGAGQWAPNLPATTRRKARRGQDPRVMRATNALYRSLTAGSGPGAVNRLTKDELVLGTNLPGAAVAQRASGIRRRRLVVVTKRRRAAWTRVIRDHVTGDKP